MNDIQHFSECFSATYRKLAAGFRVLHAVMWNLERITASVLVILVATNTLSKALSMPLMTTAGRALDPLLPYTPVFLNPIVDKGGNVKQRECAPCPDYRCCHLRRFQRRYSRSLRTNPRSLLPLGSCVWEPVWHSSRRAKSNRTPPSAGT